MPPFNSISLPDLTGKVYLVTGGNTGIGFQTIVHLLHKNATVWMGCRSQTKGKAAKASILRTIPTASIHILVLDHMDFASVISAVTHFTSNSSSLHGLINNAGIMAVPKEVSKDGWESQFQTNYLSHWLLTQHLLPILQSTARISKPGEVRIVNVSSMGHKSLAPKVGINFEDLNLEKGGLWERYGQSKLANILHVKQLNVLYGPNGSEKAGGEIWTAAVHPGNVFSELNKNARVPGLGKAVSSVAASVMNCLGVYIPADEGAYTSVFCAISEEITANVSGEYFVPVGRKENPSEHAQNMEMAKKLWEWTKTEFQGKGLL